MKRLSNRDAYKATTNKEDFKANNLFGEHTTFMEGPSYKSERACDRQSAYVVYSYGYHFPMYMEWCGVWYANQDRFSMTTSKHKGQARPRFVDTFVPVDTAWLKSIISDITGYTYERYLDARTRAWPFHPMTLEIAKYFYPKATLYYIEELARSIQELIEEWAPCPDCGCEQRDVPDRHICGCNKELP